MNQMQNRKGEIFRDLHSSGCFIMPNAWDAGSARILAGTGFSAIGTTSAGIAFAAGLPDHQAIDRETMLERVHEIAHAVDVPVSADLEAGYGIEPEHVAQTVRGAIEAGVVGCNLEDLSGNSNTPLLDAKLAAERIKAACEEAARWKLPFIVNARTDTFLTRHPEALRETIERLQLYREAGAGCLFVPGISDLSTIKTLLQSIQGPLNIVIGIGAAKFSVAELKSPGVRRISIGGSLARACFGLIRRAAQEMLQEGTFSFIENAYPHKDLCDFFAEGRRTEV